MIDLDFIGNLSLALQIIILFLLVIGLPFVRRKKNNKNLIIHGYLTVLALLLHTFLIILVMIPTFSDGLSAFGDLSLLNAITVWSHAILGTAAEILGVIIITYWLAKKPSKMACARLKKWMLPTLIIWVVSIINGALIHILGLL